MCVCHSQIMNRIEFALRTTPDKLGSQMEGCDEVILQPLSSEVFNITCVADVRKDCIIRIYINAKPREELDSPSENARFKSR